MTEVLDFSIHYVWYCWHCFTWSRLYLCCVHLIPDHMLFNVDWIICSASVVENLLSAVIIKAGGICSAWAYEASEERRLSREQRGRAKKESSKHSVWLRHCCCPQINLQSVFPSNMTPLLTNYLSRTASFQRPGSTLSVSHCLSSRLTGAGGM